MTAILTDFNQVTNCFYKGEHFSVRDNGSVLRHARDGKRFRKDDNNWTWGKPNAKTGYMEIGSEGVHRIVAKAFHGAPPSKEYVADHIDTNKKNNRPDNLRWVTRLENILLNPITAKRIAIVCGSVENFLADPLKFRDRFQEPNIKWMQSVSIEEARTSKERLMAWATSESTCLAGGTLDEWIFKEKSDVAEVDEPEFTPSETLNALQKNWKTVNSFPCCPTEVCQSPVKTYAENLKIGIAFSRNRFSTSIINEFTLSNDESTLWIICKDSDSNAVKAWSLAQVTYSDNLFVHTGFGQFFEEIGVKKQLILAQGKEWTGGDSIDDFC